MGEVVPIRPTNPAKVGEVVQVDLGGDIRNGTVMARFVDDSGTRYRIYFNHGSSLLVRPYDIVNNLTRQL